MPFIDNLEYLNLNALRAYPFRASSSRVSEDGQFHLPDDFVVDLQFSTSAAVSTRFYLSSAYNKVSEIVLEFSDDAGVQLGTFTIPSTAEPESLYPLVTSEGLYYHANGFVVVNSVEILTQQPAGVFTFTLDSAEVEARVSIPSLTGVTSLIVEDSKGLVSSLSGDVLLQLRTNLRASSSLLGVVIDAGDNLGLNVDCLTPSCIQSINGVKPDPSTGNLSLLSTGCLTVENSAPWSLEFKDECCTPCSGCGDLEQLAERLAGVETKYHDLKSLYTYLNAQVISYQTSTNANCTC